MKLFGLEFKRIKTEREKIQREVALHAEIWDLIKNNRDRHRRLSSEKSRIIAWNIISKIDEFLA